MSQEEFREPSPSPAKSAPPLFSEPQDADLGGYRAVSGLAMIGLLLGLLSPAAMFTPSLWFVPVAGIVLCLAAMVRIAREAPALLGRKAAVLGLILSVGCGSAAPSEWLLHRWLIRREVQPFGLAWFEFLRQQEPHKAHQLTQHPEMRKALDEKLWNVYTYDWSRYQDIKEYVARPVIRTLLALGDRAEVRYYDTDNQWLQDENDMARQVYAVTFEENGVKKTFFVALVLERKQLPDKGGVTWRVVTSEGGIKPIALGGQLKKS